MTNEKKQIALFLEKYPQFEGRRLACNIFSDIMDEDKPDGEKIIAESNLEHNLLTIGYKLATDWKLV